MENAEASNPTRTPDEVFMDNVLKLIQDLSPSLDQVEKDRRYIRELLNRENPDRAKILNYHLVLEYFIDRVLSSYLTDYNPMNVRMSFASKVYLLPTTDKFYRFFLKGILTINAIRNKFAHQLDAILIDNDVNRIRPLAEKMNQYGADKNKVLTTMDVIDLFVRSACSALIFYTPEFKERYAEFRKIHPDAEKQISELFEKNPNFTSLFE